MAACRKWVGEAAGSGAFAPIGRHALAVLVCGLLLRMSAAGPIFPAPLWHAAAPPSMADACEPVRVGLVCRHLPSGESDSAGLAMRLLLGVSRGQLLDIKELKDLVRPIKLRARLLFQRRALALAMLPAYWPVVVGLRLAGGSDGGGLIAEGCGQDLDVLRTGYSMPEGEGEKGRLGVGSGDLDELRRGYNGRARGRSRDAVERDGNEGEEEKENERREEWSKASLEKGRGVPRATDDVSNQRAASFHRMGLLALIRKIFGQCLPVLAGEVDAPPAAAEAAVRRGILAGGGRAERGGRGNLAEHRVHAPRKGDELSERRARMLDSALQDLGIDPLTLQDDDAAGNPARKAYYSFINPRPDKRMLGVRETLARAARRSAQQVAFLDRAYRVRHAPHVRNSDNPVPAAGESRHPVVLVLDNLRSVYNVGSVFRTAETAATELVITCGITPHPPHDKLRKTAFSAADTVPTRHFSSTVEAVLWLQSVGYKVLAMETTNSSMCYTQCPLTAKTALVLGNEVTGVALEVLEVCDGVVEIPTFGAKNSLNVASACAVVVFEALRQQGKLKGPLEGAPDASSRRHPEARDN
jgi:23S rRNA (guanosine2251-2'-O)-methyltransferase